MFEFWNPKDWWKASRVGKKAFMEDEKALALKQKLKLITVIILSEFVVHFFLKKIRFHCLIYSLDNFLLFLSF